MSSLLTYNERSWAIDVISEINLICRDKNIAIKRAGGESTLSMDKGNSLFPDVLLFGDSNGTVAIQGWELKMPDTDITNQELIDNAIKKAKRLGLNSFLLWNVKDAVIYTSSDRVVFSPMKSWSIPGIQKRNQVQAAKDDWVSLLQDIISELESLLDDNYVAPVEIDTVLGDSLYKDILDNFLAVQTEKMKVQSQRDSVFELEMNEWFSENSLEFKDYTKPFGPVAQVNIVNWINRFIFAHYLKVFNSKAESIDSITPDMSVGDVISVFDQITADCDFMNVFKPVLGLEHVDDRFWQTLLELNKILSDFRFTSIKQESLHNLIDNALAYSRKKVAGQFSTPPVLARYLAEVTIKDRSKDVIDVSCGTGTIAKAAYSLKRDKGLSVADALSTVWASDKFAFPLQLCSIALSDPLGMGQIVQVFQHDALFLDPNSKLSFTDPFNGTDVEKEFPKIHSVLSNLPFVRFEDVEKLNPDIAKVRKKLAASGHDLTAKADLYAYITLCLADIVEPGGYIGLITSNSWLGVDWGDAFRKALLDKFNINRVIISSKGRWFKNADVVTTILVLEKPLEGVDDSKRIDFLTTNLELKDWSEPVKDKMVSATLLSKPSPEIDKISRTPSEIKSLEKLGFGWSSLFVDFSWISQVQQHLVPVSSVFEVNRGERRGWDPLFYPEVGHNVEKQYIKPVLKSSRNLDGQLIVDADGEAFCCSDDIQSLIASGKNGALNWIRKFEHAVNGVQKPLPEVLERSGMYWYEMKPDTVADLVVSMNPDKKLTFYKLRQRSFVNQRLIRFTVKDPNVDVDLYHALVNSAVGMFILESLGFGRGLGVLDINASKLSKKMRVLYGSSLSQADRKKVMLAFAPLLARSAKNLTEELKMVDRIRFDQNVLSAFKINISVHDVYQSLLKLHSIRQTARV